MAVCKRCHSSVATWLPQQPACNHSSKNNWKAGGGNKGAWASARLMPLQTKSGHSARVKGLNSAPFSFKGPDARKPRRHCVLTKTTSKNSLPARRFSRVVSAPPQHARVVGCPPGTPRCMPRLHHGRHRLACTWSASHAGMARVAMRKQSTGIELEKSNIPMNGSPALELQY